GAPAIGNDVDVTTGDEEITGTSFYESGRSAEVLNLSWIGRGGHQYRIASWFSRAMHVHQQVDSIAHGRRNVVILRHRVSRLRQIAIFAAGGLRSVQSALTGFYSGCWSVGHAISCWRAVEFIL